MASDAPDSIDVFADIDIIPGSIPTVAMIPSTSNDSAIMQRNSSAKRSVAIQLQKMEPKRFRSRMETIIIFDLETTGLCESNEATRKVSNTIHTGEYRECLINGFKYTQRSEFPRITELSMISVSRATFEKYANQMNGKSGQESTTIRTRLPCSVHTRLINPELVGANLIEYNRKRATLPNYIANDSEDLAKANPLSVEWPHLKAFIQGCTKPVCIVAHNGISFDFRVLLGDLVRSGFSDENINMPNEVYFADSWLAVQALDEKYRTQVSQTITEIDWNVVSSLTRTVKPETIQPLEAIDEAAGGSPDSFEEPQMINVPEPALVAAPRALEQTPPKRPPPIRSTASEPSHMGARAHHPLRVLKTSQWSPAKRNRIRPEHFQQRPADCGYTFDKSAAKFYFSKRGSNSLGNLYESIIGGRFEAHHAQDDCDALLQICLAYGQDFLEYIDTNAALFPTHNELKL